MAPRLRFQGDANSLYSILKPSVVSASYLPPVTKVSGRYVQKHALALVRSLRAQQANLSYTKKLVVAVHGKIFDEACVQLGLAMTAREEWARTMSERLRKVCRFSAQALQKKPRATWAEELLNEGNAGSSTVAQHKEEQDGLEEEEQEEPQEEYSEEESPASVDYIYGYDAEVLQAWPPTCAPTWRPSAMIW